ncbi:hypothetical protein [Micromonospora sp. NPDC048830]|uniref:hypothetical protein n=1 Tax=Micromonospora sp. NPDC048830 TaxID=3364257 RepID=UPI00371DD5B8
MTSPNDIASTNFLARWRRGLISWLRRLWLAARRLFAGPPPPIRQSALESVSQRRRLSQPIIVPARGFVFTFEIQVLLTWHAEKLSEELLGAWSLQFSDLARRDVERQCAELARHFHPQQAGELEYRLNRELSRSYRIYERRGVVLRCRPEVRIRLDPEVREQLRAIHLQRIQEEGEHELLLRRAQRTDQLTQRWIAVLDRLRRSPLAHAAAHLTDEHLASVIGQYVTAGEKANIDLLATRLDEILRRSGRVGQPLEAHEADEVIRLLNDVLADVPDLLSTTHRPTPNGAKAQ